MVVVVGVGEATPRTVSPLIEIETRSKDHTNLEDDPSRMVSGLTSLGHILTSLGQVKLKKHHFLLKLFSIFSNNFLTIEDSGFLIAPPCSSRQDGSIHFLTSGGQFENLTVGQGHAMTREESHVACQ